MRKRAGLSQQEVADAVGVSSMTISSWELGKQRPRNKRIVMIADALGVSTEAVMNALGTDAPTVEGSAGTQPWKIRGSEPQSNNELGVRGVSRNGKGFSARLRFKGELHYLGTFGTIEEAAAARADAEKRIFGPVIAAVDRSDGR